MLRWNHFDTAPVLHSYKRTRIVRSMLGEFKRSRTRLGCLWSLHCILIQYHSSLDRLVARLAWHEASGLQALEPVHLTWQRKWKVGLTANLPSQFDIGSWSKGLVNWLGWRCDISYMIWGCSAKSEDVLVHQYFTDMLLDMIPKNRIDSATIGVHYVFVDLLDNIFSKHI